MRASLFGTLAGGGTAPFVPIGVIASLAESTPSGTSFTTGAIDTTGATLLVYFQGSTAGGSGADPTDSKGNTWAAQTLYSDGSSKGRFYVAENPIVGSGHTFNCNTDGFPGCAVIAIDQTLLSSAVDQQNGTATISATSQPGSVTPGLDNEIVICAVASNSSGATPYAIDSGFTLASGAPAVSGLGAGIAYKVQTTAGAENPTYTFSGSVVNVVASITIKHA